MTDDMIALRMRLTGGPQVEREAARGTAAIKGTEAATKSAAATTAKSVGTSNAAFKKQAALMQSTGRTMTYGLTLPLGLAAAAAVKTAADFTKTMAQVQVATGVGGAGMGRLKDLALEMGAKTIFSANDSAEAILALSKSGIKPAVIEAGALSASMNLAATESIDLGQSAEITAAAMNTFGLSGKDAGRISDALAGGANASSASVEGLALSLSQGGQSAAMYGLSVEETVGALAAFAQNGIQASDAGTSLKTFLMRLNPTSKKAREEIANLGLDFFNAQGHMKSMTAISAELGTKLGGLSDEQRGAALNVIFGSDAIRAANILYKEGPAGLERYISATKERGAAEKMANAQMEGLPGALEKAQGSLETMGLYVGEALAPAIVFGAGAVEGLANQFSGLPGPVQTSIVVLGGLVALAGPMLYLAGSAAKAVIAIRELRTAEAAGGGLLGGNRKMMLARLGVGVGGTLAAQGAGNAIGGDAGSLVSNAGTGAATGFMLGGPMGAAVGATAGSVATAVAKVSAEMHTLSWEQRRLQGSARDVVNFWGKQREAAHALAGADDRVGRAHKRLHNATSQMKSAQKHLGAVISEYGAKSQPAIHAEARLTGLIHKHRRAIKQLQNAERLRGVALSAYKTTTNTLVLAERHRINVLTQLRDRQARLYTASKQANPQSERTRDLASKLLGTENRLSDVTKKHAQTLADAASKGGQKYAQFLQHGTQEQVRFGGAIKATTMKADALTESLLRLGEAPTKPHGPGALPPTGPHGGAAPGHNAAGTNWWRGGPTWVGERGPELMDVPRGSRITAAPATRRLLGGAPEPQAAGAAITYRGGGGSGAVPLVATIKIGRKEIAEVLTEAREDAQARL